MKKLLSVLLSVLCVAWMILPASADILPFDPSELESEIEVPEEIPAEPDEEVPTAVDPEAEDQPLTVEPTAERVPVPVVILCVGVVVIAAALLVWLIVRRRNPKKGA